MVSCKKSVEKNKIEYIMQNLDSILEMSTLKKQRTQRRKELERQRKVG